MVYVTENKIQFSSQKKLEQLSQSAQFDLSCSYCSTSSREHDPTDPLHKWIYPATLPNGESVPILKILLTNLCTNRCKYCIVCAHRNLDAVSFRPEELANLFMAMVRKHLVKGIFLSSGIGIDVTKTMDKIIITAEILRFKYAFRGYIHLKILPGASFAHIEKAIQLADRVSINLEAPNARRLESIASTKNFNSLMQRIKMIDSLIKQQYGKRKTQTTQFVVGAADESDREILTTTNKLYKECNLWRVYYSAFQPVRDTPLENHPPVPLIREHRLYQVDFLFRKYNFKFDEIIFDKDGNVSLEKDPKTLWAVNHPEMFPVEVNKADVFQLIRVPGIGPISARRLVNMRKENRFHNLEELKSTGMRVEQARQFLLISGRFFPRPNQLEFVL